MFHYKACTFNFLCIAQYLLCNLNGLSVRSLVRDDGIDKNVPLGVEQVSVHAVHSLYHVLLLLFRPHVDVVQFLELLDPVQLVRVRHVPRHVVVGVLVQILVRYDHALCVRQVYIKQTFTRKL